tara:strand:- start:20967 stop:21296 length:330 start_codon:yes stop_codon:yes gene_type:complete
VFKLHGPITASQSEGPHALLRDGATLVRNVEDVLDKLGLPTPSKRERATVVLSLLPEEQRIVNSLSSDPIHIDALARLAGRTPASLSTLLLGLELENQVTQNPGQRYTA